MTDAAKQPPVLQFKEEELIEHTPRKQAHIVALQTLKSSEPFSRMRAVILWSLTTLCGGSGICISLKQLAGN